MNSNEPNVYACENSFENKKYNNFNQVINQIENIMLEYQCFVDELESFFNEQLDESDLQNFEGEIFELTDARSIINFPFTILDNKLKLVETDAWRATILSALAITNERIKRRKQNEVFNGTEL